MKKVLPLLLLLACATTREAQRPTPPPPVWTLRPPQDEENLYFVGTVGRAERLEEAKAAALDQAYLHASQFIGVEIQGKDSVRESSDSLTASVKSRVHAQTRARVVNAEVVDWFVEDRGRVINGVSLPSYRVAVLVRVPRRKLAEEKQRQREEAEQQLLLAVRQYQVGRAAEQQPEDQPEALRQFTAAEAGLATLDSGLPLSPAMEGAQTAGELRAIVAAARARVLARIQRVFLAGDKSKPAPATFLDGLSVKLTEAGFVVADRGDDAFFVVSSTATARLAGHVLGKRCAQAEGTADVRARSEPDAILSTVKVLAKGFHVEDREAVHQALHEAGVQTGEDIVARLRAWIQQASETTSQDKGKE